MAAFARAAAVLVMGDKKGFLPDTVVPDGKGGRKMVDPRELTPQFILLFTVFFICDYVRYHPTGGA